MGPRLFITFQAQIQISLLVVRVANISIHIGVVGNALLEQRAGVGSKTLPEDLSCVVKSFNSLRDAPPFRAALVPMLTIFLKTILGAALQSALTDGRSRITGEDMKHAIRVTGRALM